MPTHCDSRRALHCGFDGKPTGEAGVFRYATGACTAASQALVALWRPEPRPGHPGVLYFTRITRIYTANRPPLYYCQGTHTCYPLTSTFGLWSTQINS
jgi:hypothetical protein